MKDLKAIRIVPGEKISHDYMGDQVVTFSYRDLIARKTESIGIPAKQNGLVIIDIDVAGQSHKHDGREFWARFLQENNIPADHTYTVQTPSGGFHYYYKIPDYVNPLTFSPPGQLAMGVDVKYNGWVGAPPTYGYSIIHKGVSLMAEIPEPLMKLFSDKSKGKPQVEYDPTTGEPMVLELHRAFTPEQLGTLRNKLPWLQTNANFSYQEWRDGIFSLVAGIPDKATLEEFVLAWTRNRSWVQGDDERALELAHKSNPQGGVGPGSIFSLIRAIEIRHGASVVASPFSAQEIYDRIGTDIMTFSNDGMKIKPTEANAATVIAAAFPEEDLYHDVRSNHYVFKDRSSSEAEIVNEIIPLIQSKRDGLGLQDFKKATLSAGLDVLMARRRVDPHKKYLQNSQWDGVKRIENFFSKYCHVPSSEYVRLVSKNLWVSLAARGLNPGCKIDSMVVIEGHEGVRKSSLCQAIGGKYTYAPFNAQAFQNIDDLRQMHQAVVVELPELIGVVNQKAESVKNFLSKPYDDLRALYEKRAMRNLRGFVFIGTTNSSRYLEADMGKRRFWPIRIPKNVNNIDLTGIEVDRDQLFAEAVVEYRAGHAFYYMPDSLLDAEIKDKIITDPIAKAISDAVLMYSGRFTVYDIYRALEPTGVLTKGLTAATAKRIEDVLSRSGLSGSFDNQEQTFYWKSKDKNIVDVSDFI